MGRRREAQREARGLRKQIKSGDTGPLYLLEGEDLQSRHEMAMQFAALVDEGLHAFNVQHLYANEATSASARDALIGDVLSSARTLPMMAPRRVLTVHGAERLLSPKKSKDEDQEPLPGLASTTKRKRSKTPVEELEQYLESPEPMTTLVFVAGASRREPPARQAAEKARRGRGLRHAGDAGRSGELDSRHASRRTG